MKKERKKQKAVIQHCSQLLIESERKAEKDSIAKIEAYKKIEKHAYRRVEAEREAAGPDDRPIPGHEAIENDLDEKVVELQSELLDIEMKLQDALLVSRKAFFSKIKEINDEMGRINGEYNVAVLSEVT